MFVLSEIAGFVSRILFSSRPGRDGIAAAAFVFEGTAARAGGVATHVGEARGHRKAGRDRRCIGDLVQLEVAVEAVALPPQSHFHSGEGGFAERGAMRFDEFGDLHGRFQADGGGSLLVTQ